MVSRQAEFAALSVLILTPCFGGCLGAFLACRFPPLNPVDFWPVLGVSTSGFGVIGLLVGFLGSLWLRGRISATIIFSAILIPVTLFGWFINGKSGDWGTASVFAIAGFLAAILFAYKSLDAIDRSGQRSSP